MRILILGAAGMIGAKLAARLADEGRVGGQAITALDLVDVVLPKRPDAAGSRCTARALDIAAERVAEAVLADRPDLIFHLAAIVSGEAERDFEKGYRINLDATRALFEAIRALNEAEGYRPRLVFTSSLAVYGAPLPDLIPDDHIRAPLTSYGTQKAIAELLIDDYSRRGYFDGIGLRLPTIVIRPGRPNAAASGFFSGILREPLAGQRSVLPVSGRGEALHLNQDRILDFRVQRLTEQRVQELLGRHLPLDALVDYDLQRELAVAYLKSSTTSP